MTTAAEAGSGLSRRTPTRMLGELDEALVTGTRALEIAGRLGDLRLRILTTTYLEQAHYFRGEYERVVELATENLATLPADWVYEHFGNAMPISIYDRYWLVRSLAELGRFVEAAPYAAEALRLAEPTHHAYTVGLPHFAAGWLHLLRGDWAKARPLIEHAIALLRTGNIVLDPSQRGRLVRLGPRASRRGERGADPAPGGRAAPRASRGDGDISASVGWTYHSLGRAGSAARPARRGAGA